MILEATSPRTNHQTMVNPISAHPFEQDRWAQLLDYTSPITPSRGSSLKGAERQVLGKSDRGVGRVEEQRRLHPSSPLRSPSVLEPRRRYLARFYCRGGEYCSGYFPFPYASCVGMRYRGTQSNKYGHKVIYKNIQRGLGDNRSIYTHIAGSFIVPRHTRHITCSESPERIYSYR